MGAASQVETEIELLVGHPPRPALHRLLGEEVGQREQHTGETRQKRGEILQAAEMQHCGSTLRLQVRQTGAPAATRYALSLTGSPLTRTSVTVPLSTRTRVFSAISTSISLSSRTLVTLPTMPPPVTTVSPRRMLATISRCCFTRCCCGRRRRK